MYILHLENLKFKTYLQRGDLDKSQPGVIPIRLLESPSISQDRKIHDNDIRYSMVNVWAIRYALCEVCYAKD